MCRPLRQDRVFHVKQGVWRDLNRSEQRAFGWYTSPSRKAIRSSMRLANNSNPALHHDKLLAKEFEAGG
jgi:hypothetical protein